MADVEMSARDHFGQCHPKETPQLIAGKLKELDLEITLLDCNKDAYEEAKTKCPDQVEEFKIVFLRCDVFHARVSGRVSSFKTQELTLMVLACQFVHFFRDPKRAAKRIVKYWAKRLHMFGPDKAFLPSTLSGCFQGIETALTSGYVTVLEGVKDPAGRGAILFDPSKQVFDEFVTRLDVVKAIWYCVHAVLQDEQTQKRGVIGFFCARNFKLSQLDTKFDLLMCRSIQGILPVRIGCVAFSQSPYFEVVWPLVKWMVNKQIRKRVRVYPGKDEHVLDKLEGEIGLTSDRIPELMGGSLKLDQKAWLEARRRAGK